MNKRTALTIGILVMVFPGLAHAARRQDCQELPAVEAATGCSRTISQHGVPYECECSDEETYRYSPRSGKCEVILACNPGMAATGFPADCECPIFYDYDPATGKCFTCDR
jgi:hypothetical protein